MDAATNKQDAEECVARALSAGDTDPLRSIRLLDRAKRMCSAMETDVDRHLMFFKIIQPEDKASPFASSHYGVLGLTQPTSTIRVEDIKKAFRTLSLKVHPDKSNSPVAEAAFKVINEAYSCLTDTASRLDYDRVLGTKIAEAEQARQEQARQEQARQEQARRERARQEQARREQARREQARREQARGDGPPTCGPRWATNMWPDWAKVGLPVRVDFGHASEKWQGVGVLTRESFEWTYAYVMPDGAIAKEGPYPWTAIKPYTATPPPSAAAPEAAKKAKKRVLPVEEDSSDDDNLDHEKQAKKAKKRVLPVEEDSSDDDDLDHEQQAERPRSDAQASSSKPRSPEPAAAPEPAASSKPRSPEPAASSKPRSPEPAAAPEPPHRDTEDAEHFDAVDFSVRLHVRLRLRTETKEVLKRVAKRIPPPAVLKRCSDSMISQIESHASMAFPSVAAARIFLEDVIYHARDELECERTLEALAFCRGRSDANDYRALETALNKAMARGVDVFKTTAASIIRERIWKLKKQAMSDPGISAQELRNIVSGT